jgi:prepilin peptidase CpaA
MNHFGGTSAALLAGAVFTFLLAGACVSDLRSRRIPNVIVSALALSGIGYAFVMMTPQAALVHALGGSAVGLALWLPFWLVRVLGAGDVKLVAATGAWLGVAGVVEASLLGAAAGGVLAMWALTRHDGVAAGARRFGTWMLALRITRTVLPELTPKERRLPYGLAIGAGAAVAAWFPGLIW